MLIYVDEYELRDLYESVRKSNAKHKRFVNLLSKLKSELEYYELDY